MNVCSAGCYHKADIRECIVRGAVSCQIERNMASLGKSDAEDAR
jgi:hypothetical protein